MSFLVILLTCGVSGQEKDFSLHIEGVVAKKLQPEMKVVMWSVSGVDRPFEMVNFTVADFPKSLDWNQFKNRGWVIEFYTDKRIAFSLELSPDLFDRSRKISLKLNQPEPVIRPILGLMGDIRYTGNITRRMKYREFPRQDPTSGKLIHSVKPRMRFTEVLTGTSKTVDCRQGCFGYYWWARLPVVDPPSGTEFDLQVTYDSGGLFKTVQSKKRFKFVHED